MISIMEKSQIKPRQMPRSILAAIDAYHEHRRCQKTVPWNKDADLKALSAECSKHGFGLTAISGTFFLNRKSVFWQINERLILRGISRSKASHIISNMMSISANLS